MHIASLIRRTLGLKGHRVEKVIEAGDCLWEVSLERCPRAYVRDAEGLGLRLLHSETHEGKSAPECDRQQPQRQ